MLSELKFPLAERAPITLASFRITFHTRTSHCFSFSPAFRNLPIYDRSLLLSIEFMPLIRNTCLKK